MMKQRTFTLETRLEKSEIQYFMDYIGFYNKVYREVWQDFIHDEALNSKYVTNLCKKHKLMKRTVNSIVRDVKGRYHALVELQKQQCAELENKIETLQRKIENIKVDVNNYRNLARDNKLSEKDLCVYRNLKSKLYSLQQKKDRYRNKCKNMKNASKLAFGSKKFWKKQYNLKENGFKSYEKWLNKYRQRRDKYIYYLGSSDETCGNQMFQMKYDNDLDCFHCKIRKENKYSLDTKYIYLDINFKASRRDVLIQMLQSNSSMTYRVLRRDNKWYLQIIFSALFDINTSKSNGCIGVDFNNGFLALSETDKIGNLIGYDVVKLKYHGVGCKASTEMQKAVKKIVFYAKKKNKALVIEDLSFSSKKSKVLKKQNKRYNQMLHMLDYSRFKKLCNDCAVLWGVELIKVNPAYTSIIAKKKYCDKKKLNTHVGASYVIARRGQGYKDTY